MPDYWWFEGESVDRLRECLINFTKNPRLEVRVDKDTQAMTLRVTTVVPEHRQAMGPDINESHPCPPDCGG